MDEIVYLCISGQFCEIINNFIMFLDVKNVMLLSCLVVNSVIIEILCMEYQNTLAKCVRNSSKRSID